MMGRRWGAACVVAAALSGTAGADQGQDIAITLQLTRAPGVLRAGDVALVTAQASATLTAVEGTAFGRSIAFWPGDGEGQWDGLIGIDVQSRPGTYDLEVRATSESGNVRERMPLFVEDRKVETRRIRVAERFVNPPQAEVPRILRDAERLANVLGHSLPTRFWRGGFAPPVPGASTSSFGRVTVLNGVRGGPHRGVDFQAAEGTPVLAPNAGVVVLAGDLYFTGNTVIVDHGAGLLSLMAHLSGIDVEEGRYVAAGELLGQSGSTGRVTGPHLHWAMRLGGANIDPLSLISALRQFN
jgi:murein DD-endopeptidase MepM/ murein hydrolase activator NlpD